MRAGGAALAGVLVLAGVLAWLLVEDGGEDSGTTSPVSRAGATGGVPSLLPDAPAPSAEADLVSHGARETAAPPVEESVLRGQAVRQADGSALERAQASWILDDGSPDGALPAAITDAEGRFELAWPGGSEDRLLVLRWEPFHKLLEAGPEKDLPLLRQPCERRIAIAAAAARGVEQQFELDTGWSISGTALTPSKSLLFGARFTTIRPFFATGESDLQGRFFLRDLPHAVSEVTVIGSAPGRAPSMLAVSRPDGEAWRAPMAVIMPEEGTISGKVLYPSGAPATGGRVQVLLQERVTDRIELSTATIDEAGRFQISDLPCGSLDVVVWPDGRGAALGERVASAAWRRGVPVTGERPARVDVILPSGVEVSGRVVDGDGRPLTSHLVLVTEAFEGWMPEGLPLIEAKDTTDEAGAFVLRDVVPGLKHFVVFGPSGYDRHPDDSRLEMPEPGGRSASIFQEDVDEMVRLGPFELATPIEVGDQGRRDAELVVDADWKRPELSTVSGRIVDDAGHPIVGALISAGLVASSKTFGFMPTDPQRSTEDGRFALQLGGRRTRTVLQVAASGLIARRVPVWNSAATPDLGDIVLHRAPRLVVSVVDDVTKDLVPGFSAVLQQVGGGRPATQDVFDGVAGGVLEVDLDRSQGTWVLTLEANGWRRFRLHGEHLVGEEPMAYVTRMTRP
jgi:hypothetical protein